jgi:segregation and condensation protein A
MNDPTFRLEGVVKSRDEAQDFEGPLSLILMLLQKNKIEIRDISISEILDQYLEYLAQMEAMDLEIASEFVQMAAYLLYIKTRTLLAVEEEVTELEQLMSSLEKLKAKDMREAIKQLLPELAEQSAQGMLLWTRPQEPVSPAAKVYDYRHEGADLLRALYAVFSRSEAKLPGPPELAALAPKRIVYGVRDKSREILRILGRGPATLRALYEAGRSRSEVVATFLSVLELCSMGSVLITEQEGELVLSFTGGDTESIIEAIEE